MSDTHVNSNLQPTENKSHTPIEVERIRQVSIDHKPVRVLKISSSRKVLLADHKPEQSEFSENFSFTDEGKDAGANGDEPLSDFEGEGRPAVVVKRDPLSSSDALLQGTNTMSDFDENPPQLHRVDSNDYINIDGHLSTPRLPGTSISELSGNYDFNRMDEIGRGGFGVIYKVEDKLTGNIYAQKVLEVGKMKNSATSAKRQFICEAKVLYVCPHHDHIIKMIHTEEDKDAQEYIITLELAPMGSVKDYWAGKIPIPEPTVQNYVKQILLALQHLHNHRIIYRDLKLSNMLLMTENHLKLADFGISKVFEDVEKIDGEDFQSELRRLSAFRSTRVLEPFGSSEESSPGPIKSANEEEVNSASTDPTESSAPQDSYRAKELVGTLFYQPPEMLNRTGHSFKMDIWSLGIIIWSMAIGGMPFLLRDKKQIKRIMKKRLRFPNSCELSEEAEDFIQRCLLFEDDRQSVEEALSHPWIKDLEVVK